MAFANPNFAAGAAGVATGWAFTDDCVTALVDVGVCGDAPWPGVDGSVTGRVAAGFELGTTPSSERTLTQVLGQTYSRTLAQTVTLGARDRRIRLALSLGASESVDEVWSAAVFLTPVDGARTQVDTLSISTVTTDLVVLVNTEAYLGKAVLLEVALTKAEALPFDTASLLFRASSIDGAGNVGLVAGNPGPANWRELVSGTNIPKTSAGSGTYQTSPIKHLMGVDNLHYRGTVVSALGTVPMKVLAVVKFSGAGTGTGVRTAFGFRTTTARNCDLEKSGAEKMTVNTSATLTTAASVTVNRWERVIIEWATAASDVCSLNVSGVVTSGTAARPTGTINKVGLLNYADPAVGSAPFHGGLALLAAWGSTYPTNAEIDAALLAEGFPAFPFT